MRYTDFIGSPDDFIERVFMLEWVNGSYVARQWSMISQNLVFCISGSSMVINGLSFFSDIPWTSLSSSSRLRINVLISSSNFRSLIKRVRVDLPIPSFSARSS